MIVAVTILVTMEVVNSKMYPLPVGLDPSNQGAFKQAIANLPPGAFVLVVVGWALGSFAGTWVAARVAPRAPAVHGGIVAVLLTAAGILNLLGLPHPGWVWIVGLAAFASGGIAGTQIGADRLPPSSAQKLQRTGPPKLLQESRSRFARAPERTPG